MEVLPSPAVLGAFSLAAVVLAITPGPDMTLFLGKTLSLSRRAGFAALAGALTGILVHASLVAVGLSALLVASATAFTMLKIVGALYLLWLAVDAIRNGSTFALETAPTAEGLRSVFAKGLAINLLNPKIIVFFLTFLPQFVAPGDPAASGKLFALGLTFVVVAAPVCAAMILCAGSLARVLKRSRWATRAVDYAFATILGAFAIKLLTARAS